MRKTVYRTAKKKIRTGPLALAFQALELAGKNLRNTGVFLVKNVLSSFEKNEAGVYVLKPVLHPNQTDVLAEIERAIGACNATRAAKAPIKAGKLAALEKLHAAGLSGLDPAAMAAARKALAPPKLFDSLKSATPNPWIVLDGSVFDKALRTHKDAQGAAPFAALPAKFAEQIGIGVREDFSNWRKSLRAFAKNPSAFQGRPERPSYLAKQGLAMCKIFAGAVGSKLPSIKGRALFLDYEKKTPLPPEAFAAYAAFDVAALEAPRVQQLLGQSRRGARSSTQAKPLEAGLGVGKAVEYRLVPGRLGSTSFQSVMEVHFEIQEGSFLAKALEGYEVRPEALKEMSFEDFAKAKLEGLGASEAPLCSGADLGVNNLAALGHAGGRKGWILSGARLERKLALFDAKIDARISELAKAAPAAIQALLAQRASAAEALLSAPVSATPGAPATLPALLSEADARLLRVHDASASRDARLCALRDDRESFVSDALHQASDAMVREVQDAGSDVLIIGQNKLWKTGSAMGAVQNRRFHNLPHARLVEQLRAKSEQASILALCFEESYTSKTSFAAMEPLASMKDPSAARPVKPKPKLSAQAENQVENKIIPSKEKKLKIQGGAKPRRQAPKGAKAGSPKHQMLTPRTALASPFGKAHASGVAGPCRPRLPCLDRQWERLHADLNGAYNTIRKARPDFSPEGSGASAPSPSFGLHWLSARGVRAFAAKKTRFSFEPGQGTRRVDKTLVGAVFQSSNE